MARVRRGGSKVEAVTSWRWRGAMGRRGAVGGRGRVFGGWCCAVSFARSDWTPSLATSSMPPEAPPPPVPPPPSTAGDSFARSFPLRFALPLMVAVETAVSPWKRVARSGEGSRRRFRRGGE